MKKIILLFCSSLCLAQISDNMRTIWHPGFFIRPSFGTLSFKDQVKTASTNLFQKFTPDESNADPSYKTDTDGQSDSINMLNYGLSSGFNNILFGQWFNSANFTFDFLRPKYGDAMTYFTEGDTPEATTSKTYVEDGANTNSVHLQFEDVILHANHNWGSVLPFAGLGIDYYKLGGSLTYTNGAKRTSKVIYLPVGAYFQLNSSFAGKMQLNIPVSAKSKYYPQGFKSGTVTVPAPTNDDPDATTDETRYIFSFDTAAEFSHPVADSIGLEASMLIHSNLFGAGFKIEPYLKLWNLGAKDDTDQLSRRWRSFGLRASASF